jgi:hypothetical protein
MAKLGKPYENLVALVAKTLHPGAAVNVGEWVEGPDGVREIDVSVRGQIDGNQTFILIECKDWKSDVGIAEIDALDSKRHDVGADKTMIVSNSGFTAPALMKARRKEIMCVSALVEGDDIVRFVLNRELLAKRLSVERYSWKVDGLPDGQIPQDLKLEELEYHDTRFAAWLRDRSTALLRENEFASVIHQRLIFKQPVEFVRLGEPLPLRAVELRLECKRSWKVQTIREDVSHGLYDHLKQVLVIPDKEVWSLEFDNRNWQEITLEDENEPDEPPPETVRLDMVLFNPIFGKVDGPAPLLDEFIDKEMMAVEPQGRVQVARVIQCPMG